MIAIARSASATDWGHRKSYWKTIVLATVAAASAAALAGAVTRIHWDHLLHPPVLAWSAFALTMLLSLGASAWQLLVVIGVLIALHRDRLEADGLPYAAHAVRESAATWLGTRLRAAFRSMGTGRVLSLCAGEEVEVRSLDEILATLDSEGMMDGLPFMPEMVEYCGRRVKVFRRVDKLDNWIDGSGLKRIYNTVQLDGLRCDGAAHGGCQSSCRLRWNEAWLKRTVGTRHRPSAAATAQRFTSTDLARIAQRGSDEPPIKYLCQATELARGAPPIARWDQRQRLRDLPTGNVRLGPWFIGLALAAFNWMQRRRVGAIFPHLAPSTARTSPSQSLALRPGELVRVKSKNSIRQTLDYRNKNRGLSFDLDMVRFCGGVYHVKAVLTRVVVESTGVLKELKVPCIVLDGVNATGEYRRFNPEDEYIFWREIWLERVSTP